METSSTSVIVVQPPRFWDGRDIPPYEDYSQPSFEEFFAHEFREYIFEKFQYEVLDWVNILKVHEHVYQSLRGVVEKSSIEVKQSLIGGVDVIIHDTMSEYLPKFFAVIEQERR